MKEKIVNFVNDVVKEMRKVTWPTREELKESTMIVAVATVLFAAFVAASDYIITMVINFVLGA